MQTNTITTKNGQQLARPLKVLVPLINRDIENAENAGTMFYTAAGGKLIEARGSFDKDQTKTAKKSAMEFWDWFRDKKEVVYSDGRPVSEEAARVWMRQWEAENVRGETYKSQNEFRRSTLHPKSKWRENVRKTDYHDPVKRILSGIDHDEMRKRAATAAKEHELERTLANQLIKIGYGVLATKLHPDKGGSHDAMRRLNKVAKALREVYSTSGFLV